MLKFGALIILAIEVLQISAQCIRSPCAARYSAGPQPYAPVPQPYALVPCRFSSAPSPCMIEQPCEDSFQFPDQVQMPFALGNAMAQTLTTIPAAAGGLLSGFGGIIA